MESNSVCYHTSDQQNWTISERESDLLVRLSNVIIDRIARQEGLLPINKKCDKI